jgi:AcrR family transcriptional regulator
MREVDADDGERPVAKGPGRPRDPSVEKAILRAALRRIVSDGYSRVTIGDIAADAGVTRPTVYRRWASKQDLVVAALDFSLQEERALNPVGRFEELPPAEALKQALRHAFPSDRGMKAIGHVLMEAEQNPELLDLVRRHAITPRVRPFIDTLWRLCEEGVVRKDIDLDVVADMMIGSYYSSYIRREDSATHSTDEVVETIWPLIALIA